MEPKQVAEYMKAVGEGLKPIAEQIGAAGSKMFEYAIRHNYAVATTEVVSFGVLSVAAYKVYRYCKWGMTRPEGRDSYGDRQRSPFQDSEGKAAIGLGLGIIVGVLFCLITGFTIFDAIPRFIAPEWSAISDILAAVHPSE